MNRRYLLLLIPAYFLFTAMSCRKNNAPVNAGPVFTGKVIGGMCGLITIQFIGNTAYGQNGWVSDSDPDKKVYDHVFRVANPCTWGGAPSGDTIRFRFVPATPQTCAQCMAYTDTPDSTYSISVIK